MRIELTNRGRGKLTADEQKHFEAIAAFVKEAEQSGALVFKSEDGSTLRAEPTEDDLQRQGQRQLARGYDALSDDDESDLDVDDEGRDRSLRIGGAAVNERNQGGGSGFNQSPSNPDAADGRTARLDTDDRLSALEQAVGGLVSAFFGGEDALRKAIGDNPRQERDADGDPRNTRSHNFKTGFPVGETASPNTERLLDEVYQDPPDRGGPVDTAGRERARLDTRRTSGPWAVSPGGHHAAAACEGTRCTNRPQGEQGGPW